MMKTALNIQTAPTVEPVELSEVKEFLRVTHNDEDSELTRQITAARKFVEYSSKRQLINATWKYEMDEFPDTIEVPLPPLSSVTSLKYYDIAGSQQTLVDGTNYSVYTSHDPGLVTPYYNTTWPSTYDIPLAVELIFVAGYGAAASSVPDNYKQAIKTLVAYWYEYREPIVVGSPPSQTLRDHINDLVRIDAHWEF